MIGKCIKCKVLYEWWAYYNSEGKMDPRIEKNSGPKRFSEAACPECGEKLKRTTYLSKLPCSNKVPIYGGE